ncbi:restriction endonuclease [Rhodococcus fascians]|nr:restriction endonuclease [Rhodococcus fascians]MBY4115982.1 restriction endonuclease [Rhodococcus fascians]
MGVKPKTIQSYREAELNAVRQLVELGRHDVKATPIGADYGIDLVGNNLIGQVKWQVAKIGRPALQRLFGSRGARTHLMLFFSKSEYTLQAVAYADSVGMCLFLYDKVGTLRPANPLAAKFFTGLKKAIKDERLAADERKAAKLEKHRQKMLAQHRAEDERRLESQSGELDT